MKSCENKSNQAFCMGDLCAPCYAWVVDGKGKNSQDYRNALDQIGRDLVTAKFLSLTVYFQRPPDS